GAFGGCTRSVSLTVDSEVPVPVTQKLPLSAGVYYNDQFADYVYEEDSEDRPGWRIESGRSQTAMFDQILSTMFAELRHVDGVPAETRSSDLDLVSVPRVEEMQFPTPTEMK